MFYLLVLALELSQEDRQSFCNPVFQQLVNEGIEIADANIKLPPPSMVDGLSKDEQTRIITEIGGKAYSYAKLIRPSTVAPHIMRTDLKEQGEARYRRADFWFVTYGKLIALKDKNVLNKILSPNRDDGNASSISEADLKKREIEIDPQYRDQEGYGHLKFVLEKRVELNLTGRGFHSETEDSMVAAVIIDPRFTGEDEWANLWKPMKRATSGKLQPGEASPYTGMGLYMKATRLEGIENGLFVECHIVFSEPTEWFDGRNYLGSKLPPIVSKQVRTMRAELAKASK